MKRRLLFAAVFFSATVALIPRGRAQQPQRFLYAGVPGVGNAATTAASASSFSTWTRLQVRQTHPDVDVARGPARRRCARIAASAATGVCSSARAGVWLPTISRRTKSCGRELRRQVLRPHGDLARRQDALRACRRPAEVVRDRCGHGKLITSIDKEGSPHNTIISDDGRFAYLENQGRVTPYITVVDAKAHTVVRQIGPFGDIARPFTINGSRR